MNQWVSADSDLYENWFILYKSLTKQQHKADLKRELDAFTSEKQKRLDMYKGLLEINSTTKNQSPLVINNTFPYKLRPRIKNSNNTYDFDNSMNFYTTAEDGVSKVAIDASKFHVMGKQYASDANESMIQVDRQKIAFLKDVSDNVQFQFNKVDNTIKQVATAMIVGLNCSLNPIHICTGIVA